MSEARAEPGKAIRRVAWAVFALEVGGLGLQAARVLRADPQTFGDASIGPGGVRFGKTPAERRSLYVELMRGESENRQRAERETDQHPWNRNRDDYFHQWEWGRILWVSHQQHLPEWQGWLILEEGLREHWPPPPGIPVLHDERPLARVTPRLDKRRVFTPAPPLPAPAAPPPTTTPPAPPPAPRPTAARPLPATGRP